MEYKFKRKRFTKNVKEIAESKKITLKELAEAMGSYNGYLTKLLNGDDTEEGTSKKIRIDLEMLTKLSEKLGVSVDYLLYVNHHKMIEEKEKLLSLFIDRLYKKTLDSIYVWTQYNSKSERLAELWHDMVEAFNAMQDDSYKINEKMWGLVRGFSLSKNDVAIYLTHVSAKNVWEFENDFLLFFAVKNGKIVPIYKATNIEINTPAEALFILWEYLCDYADNTSFGDEVDSIMNLFL